MMTPSFKGKNTFQFDGLSYFVYNLIDNMF